MRSAGVAWLLDMYGFKVYTLSGGYKAFRTWVLQQFAVPYGLNILGGYTGSGKTYVLHEMKQTDNLVLDLEAIANHKGSAFGGFRGKQPTQEMFENVLALELHRLSHPGFTRRIWVEDESQRIGLVNIPNAFWNTMRQSPMYFIDIPFEERLEHIVKEYGGYTKEELVNAIIRIQKRLGGQDTKNAVNFLLENNCKESFRILLKYYDKFYKKGLDGRTESSLPMTTVPAEKVAAGTNCKRLMATMEIINGTDRGN